jgi:hypothetical protein
LLLFRSELAQFYPAQLLLRLERFDDPVEQCEFRLGVTNIRTFVSPDDPKKVAVLMDIPDMDAVMSFMQTQKAVDAMAYDGVLPETLVLLVEQRPA